MNYSYKFPVVRGVQAGREYYIAMVPLKMIGRLFPDDDEFVSPENRAQRRINEQRIPEIRDYILDNRNNYVFSALAASIDGEFSFISDNNADIGILEVALDARFLINDGQHRKAAIVAAINENPDLGNESISVVLYEDLGLARSQQMFTDLNKHAVKTSNSISELYDSRDKLAVTTRKIVSRVSFFDEYVDKEKDILGKFSSSLFTLNNIYTANKRILKREECNEDFEVFCSLYWSTISEHMIPWIDLKNRELSKVELREKYIAAQAVVIQAFGRVGAYLFDKYKTNKSLDLDKILEPIEKIDWRRSAKYWTDRVIKSNGRMINNERAIILAANMIKLKLGLELSSDELFAEQEIAK